MNAAAPHVLVVRLDSDGDVLLAGPAIRAVAATARRLTLLCGPRGRAAAALLPGVDEIVVHRAPWIDPEPPAVDRAATMALVERLCSLGCDEAFILTSFHLSPLPTALLLRLAGIPHIAAVSEDYPGSLLDVRHRVPDDVHEVERSLSLVATGGYALPPGDDGGLRVLLNGPVRALFPDGGGYIVVHPGASVPARAWSAERHARLVDTLVQEGRRVVVTGGPGEVPLTASVAGERRPEVLDLGGKTHLAELAEVIAAADAIVVGNTGPAHLAAAVGTPVVSLFAPTVPESRWRPWRVPHRMLGDLDIACAGCRARTCPFEGHPCLELVTPGQVSVALDGVASGSAGRAPTPRHRCSYSPPSPQRTAVAR